MSRLVSYIQQFGRFQRNARLYLISNALSGVTLGIILVLYNLYIVSLGYTTAFIGLLLFTGTLGAGIAIFPAGFCVDRFGGKVILIWASGLIGVAGAGQMLFRTPVPLLISTFIVGIGGAFIVVVNAPFLSTNSTPSERPHLFSLAIVLTLATTVLGEVLGGALPLWFRSIPWLMALLPTWSAGLLAAQPLARSYQLALLLAGVIAAPSFIPLFLMGDDRPHNLPRPSVFRPVFSRLRHPLDFFKRLPLFSLPDTFAHRAKVSGNENNGNRLKKEVHAEGVQMDEKSKQPGLSRSKDLLRAFLFRPLSVFIMIQLLTGAGAGLFIPYFNLYFVRHLGASPALFGVIDGAANTLNALLTLLAPWLVLRFSKIAILIVPRLLSIPLMLIIGLTGSLPLAAALYPFRQGLMDMSQGILQLFSMEVVEPQRRGFANSSYQAAYQVSMALSASLAGLIIARLGYAPVFIGAAVLYSLALLLLWSRFGQNDRKKRDTGPSDDRAEAGTVVL